ncbi:NAD-dependent succinate-semialdehyde dehydrogenase [Ottowia oryzae]
MAYQTINPYTGETLKTFPNTTDAQVQQAIESAHNAFLSWRDTPFSQRAAVLTKAAQLLRASKLDFAKILTLEMGKLLAEAQAEVELSAEILDYFAAHGEAFMQPDTLPVSKANGRAIVAREPLGVLLAVEPWNFPYYQVARILAPQLMAGNTLLLKHASNVPQSALAFEKLMRDAGLIDGAFINRFVNHTQIETILNDTRVHGVALTGSEGAGAVVAAAAGKALKKSTLELGGADAFVVLEDADLPKTAKWGVFGRHWNAGQVCVSSKRMIVVDAVFDEYLRLYTEGVAGLKAGDPMDPATTLAPLSSQGAADEVKEKIRQAVAHGATATEVGPKVPTQGAFVQPTILTNVTPDNPAYHQEFFGPVSMIWRAKDEADAVRIANDSPYGLRGSVFTRDEKRGEAVARKISTGMVFINQPTRVKADMPFGGVRRSGYGRELINLGINEFVNHKLINVVDIDAPF